MGKHIDTTPVVFGKYKGRTPEDICDYDPSYLIWAYDTFETKPCSKAMYDCAVVADREHKADRDFDYEDISSFGDLN